MHPVLGVIHKGGFRCKFHAALHGVLTYTSGISAVRVTPTRIVCSLLTGDSQPLNIDSEDIIRLLGLKCPPDGLILVCVNFALRKTQSYLKLIELLPFGINFNNKQNAY